MERRALPEGFELVSKFGRATLSRSGPRVVTLAFTGIAQGAMMPPLFEELDRVLEADGGLTVFIDGGRLDSYDSECRKLWSGWLVERRGRIGLHILVRSRLLQMGVDLVNAVVGGFMRTHHDPDDFARARAECLRSDASRPSARR